MRSGRTVQRKIPYSVRYWKISVNILIKPKNTNLLLLH